MAISFEEVSAMKEELAVQHEERHAAHRKLRDFYHGRYWEYAQRSVDGIDSIFQDIRGAKNNLGPDMKLVHNLLQEVVTKFQTYLSPLPMIRVYTDPPETVKNRARATRKERFLYGTWSHGQMDQILNRAAWYLPLMGDVFLGSIPDLDAKMVTPVLRSPEYAYPVPSFEQDGWDALIFCWEVPESALGRRFPDYTPRSRRMQGKWRRGQSANPTIDFLEFYDDSEWGRWADGQKLNGVEHKWGFNPFQQMKFISVPGEVWGHGAVEQAVQMVELGNALYSLMFQAVLENVFPRLILINPHKFPEEIDNGPGAVIGVNEGGSAQWLHPPTGLIGSQLGFLQENERAVKQAMSMPDVNFGQFNASIVTGKAINELQGAGTGSVVEMVQGVGMGSVLVGWNERAIEITRTMWADDTIHLFGMQSGDTTALNPQRFAMSLRGKELTGSVRNEVVFSPYIGLHEKLVMNLQALQAGLVSKKHAREQMGIPDTTAMDEEILAETVQDAVMGFVLGQLDPSNPQATETAGVGYLNTGQVALSTPPPVPPGALGQGLALPQGVAQPPASPGEAGSAPGAPEAPSAGAGAGEFPFGREEGVTLDAAVAAIQAVGPVPGRVFLVGEIADTGVTIDEVEIAVTDRAAINQIRANVPFDTDFTLVEDVPFEKHVEVTPGTEPVAGGEELTLESLLAG